MQGALNELLTARRMQQLAVSQAAALPLVDRGGGGGGKGEEEERSRAVSNAQFVASAVCEFWTVRVDALERAIASRLLDPSAASPPQSRGTVIGQRTWSEQRRQRGAAAAASATPSDCQRQLEGCRRGDGVGDAASVAISPPSPSIALEDDNRRRRVDSFMWRRTAQVPSALVPALQRWAVRGRRAAAVSALRARRARVVRRAVFGQWRFEVFVVAAFAERVARARVRRTFDALRGNADSRIERRRHGVMRLRLTIEQIRQRKVFGVWRCWCRWLSTARAHCRPLTSHDLPVPLLSPRAAVVDQSLYLSRRCCDGVPNSWAELFLQHIRTAVLHALLEERAAAFTAANRQRRALREWHRRWASVRQHAAAVPVAEKAAKSALCRSTLRAWRRRFAIGTVTRRARSFWLRYTFRVLRWHTEVARRSRTFAAAVACASRKRLKSAALAFWRLRARVAICSTGPHANLRLLSKLPLLEPLCDELQDEVAPSPMTAVRPFRGGRKFVHAAYVLLGDRARAKMCEAFLRWQLLCHDLDVRRTNSDAPSTSRAGAGPSSRASSASRLMDVGRSASLTFAVSRKAEDTGRTISRLDRHSFGQQQQQQHRQHDRSNAGPRPSFILSHTHTIESRGTLILPFGVSSSAASSLGSLTSSGSSSDDDGAHSDVETRSATSSRGVAHSRSLPCSQRPSARCWFQLSINEASCSSVDPDVVLGIEAALALAVRRRSEYHALHDALLQDLECRLAAVRLSHVMPAFSMDPYQTIVFEGFTPRSRVAKKEKLQRMGISGEGSATRGTLGARSERAAAAAVGAPFRPHPKAAAAIRVPRSARSPRQKRSPARIPAAASSPQVPSAAVATVATIAQLDRSPESYPSSRPLHLSTLDHSNEFVVFSRDAPVFTLDEPAALATHASCSAEASPSPGGSETVQAGGPHYCDDDDATDQESPKHPLPRASSAGHSRVRGGGSAATRASTPSQRNRAGHPPIYRHIIATDGDASHKRDWCVANAKPPEPRSHARPKNEVAGPPGSGLRAATRRGREPPAASLSTFEWRPASVAAAQCARIAVSHGPLNLSPHGTLLRSEEAPGGKTASSTSCWDTKRLRGAHEALCSQGACAAPSLNTRARLHAQDSVHCAWPSSNERADSAAGALVAVRHRLFMRRPRQ